MRRNGQGEIMRTRRKEDSMVFGHAIVEKDDMNSMLLLINA